MGGACPLSVFENGVGADFENPPAHTDLAEEGQETLRTIRVHCFESSLCGSVNPVLHLAIDVSISFKIVLG